MLLGNLLALRQTQVKRLLAFSSLAHMGYILVGVGVLAAFGKVDGGSGAFFHVITHSLMKGLAFWQPVRCCMRSTLPTASMAT